MHIGSDARSAGPLSLVTDSSISDHCHSSHKMNAWTLAKILLHQFQLPFDN